MPTYSLMSLPKTKSAEEFEEMCQDVLAAKYGQEFDLYGRKGQYQQGIDITSAKPIDNDSYIVAQCKNYLKGQTKDFTKVISKDLDSAKGLPFPVSTVIIMTALDRDAALQNYMASMRMIYSDCYDDIQIMFWDDIADIILQNSVLKVKYYPQLFGTTDAKNKWDMFPDNENVSSGMTPQKPALADVPFQMSSDPLYGRNSQLEKMEDLLNEQGCIGENRILFIKGIGGIGKSVLVKKYAELHQDEYDFVIETSAYSENRVDSAMTSICSFQNVIDKIYIENWECESLDRAEKYKEKMRVLCNLLKENKVLLLVHDYNVSEDQENAWKKLKCDVLVTTRNDWSGLFTSMSLQGSDLADADAVRLFRTYYAKGNIDAEEILTVDKERMALADIVKRVNKHPLCLKLLAKQMTAGNGQPVSPRNCLNELERNGIQPVMPQKYQMNIINGEGTSALNNNTYGHLEYIFLRAVENENLSEEQKDALRFLILLYSGNGISAKRFSGWSGMDYHLLDELEKGGWLEYHRNGKDVLEDTVHIDVAEMKIVRTVTVKQPEKNPGFFQRLFGKKKTSAVPETVTETVPIGGVCPEGVYFLPMPLKEVLSHQEEMQCQYEDSLRFLHTWMEQKAGEMNSYEKRRLYVEESRSILKRIPKESTQEYAELLGKIGCIFYELAESREEYEESGKMLSDALTLLQEKTDLYSENAAVFYQTLGLCCWNLREQENGENLRDQGFPYLEKALHIRKVLLDSDEGDKVLQKEAVAVNYDAIAGCYEAEGNHKEALRNRELAFKIRVELYGEDSIQAADSYCSIASSYWYQTLDHDAVNYFEKAFTIQERELGKENPKTLESYVRLGSCYARMKDVEKGEEILSEALNICKKVLGRFHSQTAYVCTELGHLYEKKEDYDSSVLAYREAADIYKIIYGEKHERTIENYQNLGRVYNKAGNKEESESYLELAEQLKTDADGKNKWLVGKIEEDRENKEALLEDLRIAEEELQEELRISPAMAELYRCIGDRYYEERDYTSAFFHYEKERSILKAYFTEEDHALFECLYRLALRYYERCYFQNAVTVYLEAIQQSEKLYGFDAGHTAPCYNNVGLCFQELGEREKGLEYKEKALEIYRRVLGENHADTASSYNNVGNSYEQLGEREKGLEYQEKALEIRLRVLGENHADTASSYNNVGYSYEQLGEREKGLEYQEKALEIYRRVLGENHADTANSYNNVGYSYEHLGEREKGLEYKEKALEIQLRVLGENNADIARSYNNVGISLKELGEREKGLEYQEKALEIRLRVLGENHADTANSYSNVGVSYHEWGRIDEAIEYMTKAHQIRKNILGEMHPLTIRTKQVLEQYLSEKEF